MCRPEKPLTTSNKALRELQEWLREQKDRTRQGYRALSVRAGCHATLDFGGTGAPSPRRASPASHRKPPSGVKTRLWHRSWGAVTESHLGVRWVSSIARPEVRLLRVGVTGCDLRR
jgi:hypothetical protein